MNKFTAHIITAPGCSVVIEASELEQLVELHGRLTRGAYIESPAVLSNGILAIEASDPVAPTAAAAGAQFGQTPSAIPLPPTHAPASAVADQSTTVPAAQQGTGTIPLPPAQTVIAPPPAAAAPVVRAAPAPQSGAAPAVDTKGLPWDHRIHSSKKSTIADGSWRKKTGVDPALVIQVEAELRAAMGAAPAPVAQAMIPPPPGATVTAVAAPVQVVQPPVAAPMPDPAAAPTVAATVTYAQFMEELTAPMLTGKLTLADVGEACQLSGLPNLPALIHRPDLVAAVRAAALARVRP